MPAFLPSLPVTHTHARPLSPPRRHRKPTACARGAGPSTANSPLPLDPLHAFEAFCYRTQASLCTQTAQADGLGTFTIPGTYPPHATETTEKTLLHGRRFRASVDVFRSPPHQHQSVGVAFKLTPHDPTLPALRADVHYFQSARSWWFGGGVDLATGPATCAFGAYVHPFLARWRSLRERYRVRDAAPTTAFLDACYAGVVQRDTAFGFIGDVVDGVLPAYLPLLHVSARAHEVEESEVVESFCIEGGAACQSSTLKASPLASWSFSIAPNAMTSAGRVYDTMRETAEIPESTLYTE